MEKVYADISAAVKRYEPEQWPGLYLRFDEDSATVLLFRTGKFNIAGASSIEELHQTHEEFIAEIASLLNKSISQGTPIEVRNMVFVDTYNKPININRLISVLGLGNIEYEPEQFPALDYRPPEQGGLFKIFSSGKISLTGVTSSESVDDRFSTLMELIQKSEVG